MMPQELFRQPRIQENKELSILRQQEHAIEDELKITRKDVLAVVGDLSPQELWHKHRNQFEDVVIRMCAHLEHILDMVRLCLEEERIIERKVGKKLNDKERSLLFKIRKDEQRLKEEIKPYYLYWMSAKAHGAPQQGRKLFLIKSMEMRFYTTRINRILEQFQYDDETLEKDTDSFLHSLVKRG